jgi:glycosyltransferase involved in cell wall biosynthesis
MYSEGQADSASSGAKYRMSLKVCYLLPRLLPGKSGIIVGGCATNCVSLALELRRQGAQIEILASVPEKCLESLSRHPAGEIIRPLPSIGTGLIGKGIGAIQVLHHSLKNRMRETHYDVVHSHSGTYPYAIVPLAANRKTSVRLHSLYCPIGTKGGVYTSWWEKPIAARLIFNKLDRVIAVTENVRQSIERAGVSSEKIEVIPMCVDTQRFSPRQQSNSNKYFPKETKGARILFVGNASKEKGLVELLQAVGILIQKRIPLFLVATIENQSQIKEYSVGYDTAKRLVNEMGFDKHVRFLDLVDSIENLYAESDIIVIPWNTSRGPSDYPMVVIEGMVMGKCIISTPVGGCPELLKDGKAGILTEGFSAESIAITIEFAIKHPEIRRLKSEVAMETVNNFSVETSAKHMINLYERLLKGKA